jgi:hypothetical protein
MDSLTFRDVPQAVPKDQAFPVLSPPEYARRWVPTGATHQGGVLTLLHCDVRAGFLVRNIGWH